MAWTKTKTAVVGVIIAIGMATALIIQNQNEAALRAQLRQQADQIAELQADNQRLSAQLADRAAMLRLPAARSHKPAVQIQSPTESAELISRLLHGENTPKLTAEQIAAYLKANQRNAAGLIAAFRATGDQTLLREAIEKYPNDPLVNFAAVFSEGSTAEERREHLDALKKSAPENALGNFLSAFDDFKSGHSDLAVEELRAAVGKTQFEDFTKDLVQNSEEAYLADGYSVAEAKTLASSQVLLPHLAELKQLGERIVELANSYRRSGDEGSAQAALQIASNLGQRFNGAPGEPLVSQLVGLAIERNALNAMNPNSAYGNGGLTVSERLQQIAQQNTELKTFAQQFGNVQAQMTAQDWINYSDRRRAFGEFAAERWFVNKYPR